MDLTGRDRTVLWRLAAARWLSTTQVAALCFPKVSDEMARRRLRLLREARYICSVQENPMADALHTLGPRGRDVLRERGWKRAIALERYPPANLEHFLGINDIRIAVERSAERDQVELGFFFASWELQQRGWNFSVVPDAAGNLDRAERSATVLFEYDRTTEPLGYVVRTKIRRYAEGLEGFPFSHVVVVADSAQRLEHLRDATVRQFPDRELFTFIARDALLSSWSVRDLVD